MRPIWTMRLTLLTSALATGLGAQQPSVQIQTPPNQQQNQGIITLQANARTVLLDVVVNDGHGHPVRGLTANDFQIFENGAPQTITSIEEHHPPTAAELAAQPKLRDLGPNTFSNRKQRVVNSATTVFLLDGLDSSPQAQAYARSQLLGWVKEMTPGTQVAIFQMDTQLHLIQGFTSDPAAIETAIKQRYKPVLTAVPGGNTYTAQAIQMDVLTNAMRSLGAYLQTRAGRKNLVWFTGRVPRATYYSGDAMGGALGDAQNFAFDYSKATEALTLGEVSVYPIDTRGLQVDPAYSGSASGVPKNNTGFTTRQFFQHADLDAVAEATGGKAFYNTNGIKQAVEEVIETGSSFYTLSFSPTNKKWDGRYRSIKLESDSPGAQLEYRRGYYATTDFAPRPVYGVPAGTPGAAPQPAASQPDNRIQLTHSQADAGEAAFARSMHLGAIDPGQIIFATQVKFDPAIQRVAKDQPLPKDNHLEAKYHDHPFRNYTVSYLIPGSQLMLPLQPDGTRHGEIEFVAVLVDDKDTLVNSFSQTVTMNVKPDTYVTMLTRGLEVPIPIAVPEKGNYFIRVGIRDKNSGHAGTIEINTTDVKPMPKP